MDNLHTDNSINYFAFISYKREDEKWAKWLQHKIEYYNLPTSVRKAHPHLPKKIQPVFKDTTDLEPGVLADNIQEALNNSKFLIVICSPRSANSVWVSKEVQSFIDTDRSNYIIPFIIGGTPNAPDPKEECFPEGLRNLTEDQELLGVNINEMGRDAAAIKVVARMLNLRFDTLWQRYLRRKRKHFIGLSMFAIFMLILLIIMSWLYSDRNIAYHIVDEKNKSLDNKNRELVTAYNKLKQSQDSIFIINSHLNKANANLYETNIALKNERENLQLSNISLYKRNMQMIAKTAHDLYKEGKVLPALSLVLDNLSSKSYQNSIIVPEVMEVLLTISAYLSLEGYKKVDLVPQSFTIASEDSSVVSSDGKWAAYTVDGHFYLYDFRNSRTIMLPGTDNIEYYSISFSPDNHNILYSGSNHVFTEELSKYEILKSKAILDSANTPTNQSDLKMPLDVYSPNYESIILEQLDGATYNNSFIWFADCYATNLRLEIIDPEVLKVYESPTETIEYNESEFIVDRTTNGILTYNGNELIYQDIITGKTKTFIPFVNYTSGSIKSGLLGAKILDNNNILCVNDRGFHCIYNLTNDDMRGFSFSIRDPHFGSALGQVCDFYIKDNWLYTLKLGASISIYDIQTGSLIAEYDHLFEGFPLSYFKSISTDGMLIALYLDDNYEALVKMPDLIVPIAKAKEFLHCIRTQ